MIMSGRVTRKTTPAKARKNRMTCPGRFSTISTLLLMLSKTRQSSMTAAQSKKKVKKSIGIAVPKTMYGRKTTGFPTRERGIASSTIVARMAKAMTSEGRRTRR